MEISLFVSLTLNKCGDANCVGNAFAMVVLLRDVMIHSQIAELHVLTKPRL